MEHDEPFAAFMATAKDRLYRVAYLLSGDAGEAEELTQHALVRTYTAWARLDRGDPYGYARRILVNLHTDRWRRLLRREQPAALLPDRPATGRDPADTAVARTGLTRALRQLTRRERAVVVCRYYLDLTEQQTADELGIALGTVKSATARALGKLRVHPELRPVTRQEAS
ncbi:SigE family RNA polymerase sigma factor [Dactylosporangium sucinum]|uniref:DNA-directed RNA polymerase sigma-70 factor n=1 Tax=Dactylosporangium sucinum TaxID=1424081 RepID=A0A917TN14_9ACTN|nr:SigE family RNA polymerase sigma factor [Dactylosporangium sucinum]GGM29769.1 DNA-directed RNA polymerase sigma-70 factor [Dactylosporangium sucinum]